MKFKCKCKGKTYKLRETAMFDNLKCEPTETDWNEDTGGYFTYIATCESCGDSWFSDKSTEELLDIMMAAGVIT